MSTDRVRQQPCAACHYRRDVPSGLWMHDEYEKLRRYDEPTSEQPMATFQCHATPEFYCHGWAVVHSNRGREFELLALRFALMRGPVGRVPEPAVPLFESGNAAADFGARDIARPSRAARAMQRKLLGRYPRLQKKQR